MSASDQAALIHAKEATVGETYLVASLFYAVKILKKYGDPDTGYVSSILVESENEIKPVSIAGGTELIPYSKELHKALANQHNQSQKGSNTMGAKAKTKTSVPRSQIIDRELLKYKGKDPDFEAIATAVIKSKAAPEGKRTSVISQAKVRHNWYTKDGKKNPAAEKPSSVPKQTTKAQPQPSK